MPNEQKSLGSRGWSSQRSELSSAMICNTSGHIASTPRLAERCGRLSAGVSLPARARKRASGVRSVERTPFFWRHYVRLFTFFFSTR